jgi:hypothetical protein
MAEVAVEHASLASDVLQKHLHILPAVYISCKNRSGDGGCDEDVLNHRDRGRFVMRQLSALELSILSGKKLKK